MRGGETEGQWKCLGVIQYQDEDQTLNVFNNSIVSVAVIYCSPAIERVALPTHLYNQ